MNKEKLHTVIMKCDDPECGETWKTGMLEIDEGALQQIFDPYCDNCGNAGFVQEHLEEVTPCKNATPATTE